MKIVFWQHVQGEKSPLNISLLFGLGLIGKSILRALCRETDASAIFAPFSWSDEELRGREIEDILARVIGLASHAGEFVRINTIWSAGAAGFGANQSIIDGEAKAFDAVLDLAKRLRIRLPGMRHRLFLVSSAGGLFEGFKHVDCQTQPSPLRPYGMEKLRQEEAVAATVSEYSIYRPASVYGYEPGGRAGLITTLISNALEKRPSRIFGNSTTLRDYVLADDIGSHIALELAGLRASSGIKPSILASGQPVAMDHAIHAIERILNLPVYRSYDHSPTNAQHMSFRRSAIPSSFRPTTFEIGVYETVRKMVSRTR